MPLLGSHGSHGSKEENLMRGKLTAIIEKAAEGGYWAICPEVPGANGQGESIEEVRTSLIEAVKLIFEDPLEDLLLR